MKRSVLFLILGILFLIVIVFLSYRSVYNREVKLKQKVQSQWANVESAYQRRLDLIPNLVNTVKGYADFEKETLTQVVEARSRATSVNVDLQNLNQANFNQFQDAQNNLTSALSRLLVVVEKYPELKANQNFLELQAQLEGTENRINVERNRYNEQVGKYNTFAGKLFRKQIFGYEPLPYFKADEAASKVPAVNF